MNGTSSGRRAYRIYITIINTIIFFRFNGHSAKAILLFSSSSSFRIDSGCYITTTTRVFRKRYYYRYFFVLNNFQFNLFLFFFLFFNFFPNRLFYLYTHPCISLLEQPPKLLYPIVYKKNLLRKD